MTYSSGCLKNRRSLFEAIGEAQSDEILRSNHYVVQGARTTIQHSVREKQVAGNEDRFATARNRPSAWPELVAARTAKQCREGSCQTTRGDEGGSLPFVMWFQMLFCFTGLHAGTPICMMGIWCADFRGDTLHFMRTNICDDTFFNAFFLWFAGLDFV